MANRYWVYNGGNINDTTHWSATSGGAGGASKPTLSDNVIFDANSFTLSSQVVTLNEAFNCLSMDFSGISKTVTLSSSVFSLNLYGNLTLATNLTWLFTGTAYLNHKATGTVTTNGVTLNANRVYFDAAGITVTNADAANYGVASFYLTNGTWNTNGKTITSTGSFNTVTGTKTLTLGASVFNIGAWTNIVPSGFTLNYNTSTVVITTASILTGITTFYNLTCSGVTTLTLANNITVTNALTLAGSSVSNRLKILSSVAGTQRIITVPAVGVFPSNLDAQDIAFPNAVDMSAIVGYSQDFGNNTGITFTASVSLFFKHTSGAANWGDITKWFLADRSTQGRIPLIQDDVNFDNLSFTETSTLTLNILATCRSMNWTGLNQTVTFSSSVNSLSIYGHITLATGLVWTFTGTAYTYLSGLGTFNISSNGIVPAMNVLYFDRTGGSWNFLDTFNSYNSSVLLLNGNINTNDNTIIIKSFFVYRGTSSINLGSSLFTCNALSYNSWSNGFTFNSGTSTITINSVFDQIPRIIDFYNLVVNYSSLKLSYYTTIRGTLTVKGINSNINRAIIYSSSMGAQISITAANVVFENVDLRDIKGLGAANWDLTNIPGGSGDCGGNSNITFTPSQTQYYKHHSGACNWSDAKWYDFARTTLGRVPLPQDDAVFDASSFTGVSTLTINVPRVCKNLDMSGINKIITLTKSITVECYGSFILNNNISLSFAADLNLIGRGLCNLHMFNKYMDGQILFAIGSFTLLSDINVAVIAVGYLANLDCNDFNIITTSGFANAGGGGADKIYFRSGTIIFNHSAGNANFNPLGTIDFGTSIFKFNAMSGTYNVSILYGGKYYAFNKIWLSGTHVGGYQSFMSFSVNELIIDAGRKISFIAGSTVTIGKLTALGTQANPVTIGSITAAPHNLIKTGADMVEVEYCNISNSNATPSDKWAGGDTSVDGGGNSGWTFKFIPIIMWFFGIFSKK